MRGVNKNIRLRFVKKDKRYESNPLLAKDTLDIAQQNLRASKILYDNECYPEAVFFLQQSVEKGCKSFGFQLGLINEQMASSRDIGHTTTNIYVVIIDYFKETMKPLRRGLEPIIKKLEGNEADDAKIILSIMLALKNGFLENELKLKSFEDQFHSFAYEKKMYSEITEEKLDSILSGLQEVDSQIIDKEKEADGMFDKLTIVDERIKSENRPTIDKYNILDNLKNVSENATNWIALTTFYNLRAIMPLLVLAVITQPHEQSSRYVIKGTCPRDIINKDSAIIIKYGRIYTICDKALSMLSE